MERPRKKTGDEEKKRENKDDEDEKDLQEIDGEKY